MTRILHTEKEYRAAMTRLEYLIDHEPGNLDEIKALGYAANEYENKHGHRPCRSADGHSGAVGGNT